MPGRGSLLVQHSHYNQICRFVYSKDHWWSSPAHLHAHGTRLSGFSQKMRSLIFYRINIYMGMRSLVS